MSNYIPIVEAHKAALIKYNEYQVKLLDLAGDDLKVGYGKLHALGAELDRIEKALNANGIWVAQ